MPVRHVMRRAHLSARTQYGAADDAAAEAAWRTVAGPIAMLAVGLEAGVLLELPGLNWDTTGYDPRVRPWYRLGIDADRPTWGEPFRETETGALLLPCSMEIGTHTGERHGVATLTTSFSFLIEQTMTLRDHAAVHQVYLVDAAGKVMLRSREDLSTKGRVREHDKGHETPDFHHADLLPRLDLGEDGHLWVDQGRTLLVHFRLATRDWSLVVEAAAERVIHGDLPSMLTLDGQ